MNHLKKILCLTCIGKKIGYDLKKRLYRTTTEYFLNTKLNQSYFESLKEYNIQYSNILI